MMYSIAEPNVYSKTRFVLGESGTLRKYTWEDTQYDKKNGLTRKTRMLAILGISVVVMVLAVSIVYWLVMRNKMGKQVFAQSFV
ncbi:hypothetical protein CFP56_043629 [Quercus suber]|uniref:Uncharacterized protein n=1 Tax=Quercus suber TaxID=58331 RepID=A0AAW0LGG5_QUESU